METMALTCTRCAHSFKIKYTIKPKSFACPKCKSTIHIDSSYSPGAEVGAQRETALAVASSEVTHEFLQAVETGQTDIVKSLLARGADPNATDNGRTALMCAAVYGHTDIMRLLIKKGANVNAATSRGTTALHMAARCRETESMKVLIEEGADVNAKADLGMTPLMEAADQSDGTDGIRLLIEKGADINAKDDADYTVLLRVKWRGYAENEKVLLNHTISGQAIGGATSSTKLIQPAYPEWMVVPDNAKGFTIDAECQVLPWETFACPKCFKRFGNLPSSGPGVKHVFNYGMRGIAGGAPQQFAKVWWTEVRCCGQKYVVSNRGK